MPGMRSHIAGKFLKCKPFSERNSGTLRPEEHSRTTTGAANRITIASHGRVPAEQWRRHGVLHSTATIRGGIAIKAGGTEVNLNRGL
jgi:hypothetical protein